ncbi:SDR family oxidoreductase [uncultured Campylobacter sp.]|uniref:SDR family NAD(P)-dependent oxidoreductase n=1 Tax=uncultured Campylobacter sp. TaxID=218934 RepID=UPI0026328A53|nr:SDR family NAD(P)-dependent oxidoreductase [uncultured Campylobacter sp.]
MGRAKKLRAKGALINNAGFGDYGAVGERDLSKISQMLELSIISLALLSHLFVRDYKHKPAQLINISSAGGYSMVSNAVTYCASKFFVSAFTEGLHRELAQDKDAKMQAKVLAPAATKSEFCDVASGKRGFDYDAAFSQYHSSEQTAEFLLTLYDSDACIGEVDLASFEFKLSEPKFNYIAAAK